jgi:alpha-mannosidase
VLQLDIELEPSAELTSDPWNSYYACRFAWSDEAADLYASVNQTRQRLTKKRIESPLFVELQSGERHTTLLTGGIPYHRRVSDRMLDTLLIVRGERARTFRLGIGIDLSQPLPASLNLLAPPVCSFAMAPPPISRHCWLFHLDARSVVATHWFPLREEGRIVGVQVRLLESAGRNCRARLTAFRPFRSARQLNFLGEPMSQLAVEEGKVVVDVAACEWIEVEARWETGR